MSAPHPAPLPVKDGERENLLATARARLDEAVDALHAAGDSEFICRGLLARAALFRTTGAHLLAMQDLNDAQEIADRSGMKLFQADIALERARLTLARGTGGVTPATPAAVIPAQAGTRPGQWPGGDGSAPSNGDWVPAKPNTGLPSVGQHNARDDGSASGMVSDNFDAATRLANAAHALITEAGYQRRIPDLAMVRAEIALRTGQPGPAKAQLAVVKAHIDAGWGCHVTDYTRLMAILDPPAAPPEPSVPARLAEPPKSWWQRWFG